MQDRILAQVHLKLLKRSRTLAVAESCTGGLLSSVLTQNPGASGYLRLGVVSYSNRAKEKILHVPTKTLAKYGAVSRQTATAMAENIRKIAKTDLGLGLTGIAGPSGATESKPVGTVFICLASAKQTTCRKFSFKGNRTSIQKQAVREALKLLCAHLSR